MQKEEEIEIIKPLTITIEQADNGVVVTSSDGCKRVYQYLSEIDGHRDISNIPDMLYSIVDCLGLNNSRYVRQRIHVGIEHGDKYECTDKNCEICKVD